MQPTYLEGGFPGSIGVSHKTGSMNSESFIKWLEHFLTQVGLSEVTLVPLINNYSSHVTLDAMNLQQKSYITILGFPVHKNHKM